jgi:hypothetical protein
VSDYKYVRLSGLVHGLIESEYVTVNESVWVIVTE